MKPKHPIEPLVPLATDQPVRAGKEVQVLFAVHVSIGAKRIRHETKSATDEFRVIDDRESVNKGITVAGQIKRCENPHRRRLARPVGPDVSKHMAALNGERNVVNRLGLAKEPVQADEVQCSRRRRHERLGRYGPKLADPRLVQPLR